MGRDYPQQPVPAVAAVVFSKKLGAVLLVRRANPPSQGEWSLPGGVLELGETMEAGLVREVKEETGVDVELAGLVDVLDHIVWKDGRVQFHYVLTEFLCRVRGGSLESASDALDARWAGPDELAALALSPRTMAVIHKAFRMAGNAEEFCL